MDVCAVASEAGQIDDAVELSRRSTAIASRLDWTWWVSGQHLYLARLALLEEDVEGAEREACAALQIARTHENRLRAAGALSALAQAALARADLGRAGRLWGSAESELERLQTREDLHWFGGKLVAEADPAFTTARASGRQLELWDAVAIALGEASPPQTVP